MAIAKKRRKNRLKRPPRHYLHWMRTHVVRMWRCEGKTVVAAVKRSRDFAPCISLSAYFLQQQHLCAVRCFCASSSKQLTFHGNGKNYASLTALRGIRTVNNNESSKSSANGNSEKEKEKSSKETTPPLPPLDENTLKKIRLFVLAFGFGSSVLTFYLLNRWFSKSTLPNLGDASNTIEMEEFLQTYLPSGEVRKIVYLPHKNRAVAWLHDGAIINGAPAPHPIVFVKYRYRDGLPLDQFRQEVRAQEKLLHIPLRNGIPIQEYRGFTAINYISFVLGILLLTFLMGSYAIAIARRLMQQKGAGGMKKP